MANHNSRRYSNEPIRYQSYLLLAEGRENERARATQDTIFSYLQTINNTADVDASTPYLTGFKRYVIGTVPEL